jgi:spore germination cell wall hydrolase CwlJ-like protein
MSKKGSNDRLVPVVLLGWVMALSYFGDADAADLRKDASAEARCVALTVFAESRSESYLGQAAVAGTAVERARRLGGANVCDVVQAAGQYVLSRDPWLTDKNAWAKAVDVAESVISGDYDLSVCAGATHFHNVKETPYWSRKFPVACRVDSHIFYRE